MKSRIPALLLSITLALPLVAQEDQPGNARPGKAKPLAEKPAIPTKNVTVDEAEKLIKSTPGLIVLDVRSPEEFDHEHIKGAVNINVLGNEFEAEIAKLDPAKPVLVHCAAGRRSSIAIEVLQEKAKFPQIYHMNEGFAGWKKAKKAFEEKPLPRNEKPAETPAAK